MEEARQNLGQHGRTANSVLNQLVEHLVRQLALPVVVGVLKHPRSTVRVHLEVLLAHVLKHEFVPMQEWRLFFQNRGLLRNPKEFLFTGKGIASAIKWDPGFVLEFLETFLSPQVLCLPFVLHEAVKESILGELVATDLVLKFGLDFLDQLESIGLNLLPQIADCFEVKGNLFALIEVLFMQTLIFVEFVVYALL